jgi:hypothetical protein
MKSAILLSLLLFPTLSQARRCLPDASGAETFASRCDVIVVSTRTPECHVNEPWNYPHTATDRNDNWYHVHGWNQSSQTAKSSTCDVTFEDCKYFAFKQLSKFREVNPCGYVSVGKKVEYRFQTFSADRTVETERVGRMSK